MNNEARESISQWLDELCSFYMAIGVGYDEFWYGDFTRLKYYVEANKNKRIAKNEEMWLQGMYFDNALQAEIHNLASKKGAAPKKYLEKPIEIFPKTEREKELEKKQEDKKLIKYLDSLIAKQGVSKENRGVKNDGND